MAILTITNGEFTELSVVKMSPVIEDCLTIYEFLITTNIGDAINIELTGNHYEAKYFNSVSEISFTDNTSLTYDGYLKVRFLLLNSGNQGVFSNATIKITNTTLSKYYENLVQRNNDQTNCYDSGVYVSRAGDSMTGDLDMSTVGILKNIKHIHVANESYTDKGGYIGMFNGNLFGIVPFDPNNIISRPQLRYNFISNKWEIESNEILTSSILANFVTIDTAQIITGQKTFSVSPKFDRYISLKPDAGLGSITTYNALTSIGTTTLRFIGANKVYGAGLNFGTPSAERTYLLPDKNGTVAMLSDIVGGTVMDSTPTDSSSNGVESNGVYDALVDINTFAALNSINGNKLLDNSINPLKLSSGIPGSKIQSNSIGSTEIGANAIGQSELSENAVDLVHINDENSPNIGDALTYSGTGLKWETVPQYKQGTFTPDLLAGATSPYTTSSKTGSYIRIGNLVNFTIFISGINNAGTGDISIINLPYTATISCIFPIHCNGGNVNFYSITGETASNRINIKAQTTLDANNVSAYSNVTFTTGTIRVSGSYITAEIFS